MKLMGCDLWTQKKDAWIYILVMNLQVAKRLEEMKQDGEKPVAKPAQTVHPVQQ